MRASIAGLEKPSQYAITFAPIFIAYSAALINPEQFSGLIETDSQRVLPTRLLEHTPDVAQAIFFAAALLAIMSCSSATLRAPSVAFLENTAIAKAQGGEGDPMAELELERQKAEADIQLQRERMEIEFALKKEELNMTLAIKREEHALDSQLKQQQAAQDAEIKQQDAVVRRAEGFKSQSTNSQEKK